MATVILNPLPAPGVAVEPNLIARQTEVLTLTRDGMSKDWTVSLADGTPVLVIEGESFSMSHRKSVKDARGSKLYEIRRETFTIGTTYYAEVSDGGKRIWEMESHSGFTGSKNTMTFQNVAAGGATTRLDFKNNAFGREGTVKLEGHDVAVIERKMWKMRHEYQITVTAGLDMSLIVGLVVAMDDKVRSQQSSAAAASAGGGGGC